MKKIFALFLAFTAAVELTSGCTDTVNNTSTHTSAIDFVYSEAYALCSDDVSLYFEITGNKSYIVSSSGNNTDDIVAKSELRLPSIAFYPNEELTGDFNSSPEFEWTFAGGNTDYQPSDNSLTLSYTNSDYNVSYEIIITAYSDGNFAYSSLLRNNSCYDLTFVMEPYLDIAVYFDTKGMTCTTYTADCINSNAKNEIYRSDFSLEDYISGIEISNSDFKSESIGIVLDYSNGCSFYSLFSDYSKMKLSAMPSDDIISVMFFDDFNQYTVKAFSVTVLPECYFGFSYK